MTATADSFARYWDALTRGDSVAAVDVVVEAQDAGVPLPDLLDEVVCAAQAEVGRRWAANEWSVAQEHRATSISEDAVATLASRAGTPAPTRGRVVVACADGEWHSLPSRVLAATLRHAGWQVTYLGASVPARHLAPLLHDVGPDVVALSCALPLRLVHARTVIEATRAAGVPVLVGGPGFGPEGRWGTALGADAWAPDARAAVRLLDTGEIPSFTTPAPPLRPPDTAAETVRAARDDVVRDVMGRLVEDVPSTARYDDEQRARTQEDIGHIVDFLAAALYVDDEQVFTDFVRWMVELLDARGVPPVVLRAGLDTVAAALDRLVDAPRARAVLTAGREVIAP